MTATDTTERMPLVGADRVTFTPDEPWHDQPWYTKAADFAVVCLGRGDCGFDPDGCLVIGSPQSEVRRLWLAGWQVTYLDCREPPDDPGIGGSVVIGDATAMPFPDASFSAVSSTCVLCHAGLGRYGDPVKPNGDVMMMAEIARVLKPGGLAVIMAGPAIPDDILIKSVAYANIHRVYRPADVATMAAEAGLELVESVMYPALEWIGADAVEEVTAAGDLAYSYLSVLLRKVGG